MCGDQTVTSQRGSLWPSPEICLFNLTVNLRVVSVVSSALKMGALMNGSSVSLRDLYPKKISPNIHAFFFFSIHVSKKILY